MNRIEELTAQRDALRAELLDLDAVEEPTEEQVTRSQEALDEFDQAQSALEAEQARVERMESVRAAYAEPSNREAGFSAPQVHVNRDPFENVHEVLRSNPNDEDVIARAHTALSDVRSHGTSDAQRAAAIDTVETVSGAAVHALVYGSPHYRSAFQKLLHAEGRGRQAILSEQERYALELAEDFARADYSLTGANGGYMLPTLLDPTLILTGTRVNNPIRNLARKERGTQNVWHGVSHGAVTSYWTAEASAMTAGNGTLSNPSVTAAKATAYLPGSYEIFEDSNLAAQLPVLVGESFDDLESAAFVSGSGSDAPTGIVTAISATAGSTVTATTRGSFTSASSADVYAVLEAVSPRFQDSVTWVGNVKYFNTIAQMDTSGGGLFWQNFNGAAYQRPPLLGYPVETSSSMASVTTSGTAGLILGDWSRFLVYDRIGTQIEFVQNVVNSSGLPTGERAYIAHKRVGSNCLDVNAFRFLKT